MSIYEIIMLICFGAAWPASIRKTLKTKTVKGQSKMFLSIVCIGYIAGILHKLFYHMDGVIYLYIINLVMVLFELFLVIKYRNNTTPADEVKE